VRNIKMLDYVGRCGKRGSFSVIKAAGFSETLVPIKLYINILYLKSVKLSR
jgi:hypothetical protein